MAKFEDELRDAQLAAKAGHARLAAQAAAEAEEAARRKTERTAVAREAYSALVEGGAEVFAFVKPGTLDVVDLCVTFDDDYRPADWSEAVYLGRTGLLYMASAVGFRFRRARMFESADYMWGKSKRKYRRIDGRRVMEVNAIDTENVRLRYPWEMGGMGGYRSVEHFAAERVQALLRQVQTDQ